MTFHELVVQNPQNPEEVCRQSDLRQFGQWFYGPVS